MMRDPSTQIIEFTGGVDLVTPDIFLNPGRMVAGVNIEQRSGQKGYHRVDGFERFDGHSLPSSAAVTRIVIDSGTGESTSGETFIGATSGATVTALDEYDLSGDHVDCFIHDGPDPISGEQFDSSTTSASFVAASLSEYSEDSVTFRNNHALAMDLARADILPVPGSGPVRGVVRFGGTVYSFRDNDAGTECLMYRESPDGWEQIEFGDIIPFDSSNTGSAGFVAGDTLTQAAESADLVGVVKQSGGWAAGDASGYLIIKNQTGQFTTGTITNQNGDTVNATTGNSPVTLNPGGRFRFRIHNFYGNVDMESLYWVDGENRAFEFNGTDPVPIHVNNLTEDQDKPTAIGTHQSRLWLGYRAGSVQISGIIDPKVFDVIDTATYYDPGDVVTGIKSAVGDALVIACEKSIWIMQGQGLPENPWVFNQHGENNGSRPYSMQGWTDVLYVDRGDLKSLSSTERFGDFLSNPLSADISPWLADMEQDIAASCIVHTKSQYRLFFSNKNCLVMAVDKGQPVGFTLMDYPFVTECVHADFDGSLFAGSDDGFVYKLDSGNSFDGEKISGFIRTPFHAYGNPRVEKRFMRVDMQFGERTYMTERTSVTIDCSCSGGNIERGYSGPAAVFDVKAGGGIWDEGYQFDGGFSWDGAQIGNIVYYPDGIGTTMNILLSFESDYDNGFMIHSAFIDFINLYLQA